ncbi:MAG TPA: hypothetical protein VF147_05100 [Vicinamibacterales bacterium]
MLSAAPLAAQDPPAAPPPASGGASAFGKKVIGLFSKPLHPIVKSVAPGGGFGPGVAYTRDRKTGGPWFFRTEAVVTPYKYWNAEATVQYQNDWLHGEGYGRAREMGRLDFFGIGTDSSKNERTNYAYTDRSAGALVSARPRGFDVLGFGGRVDGLWPDIGQGRNKDVRSIEQVFTEATAPGLDSQPTFAVLSGFVNVNYPGGNALGRHGADVQLAFSSYRDLDDGHYDFDRLTLDSQQRLPGFSDSHLLTLHQYFSATGASDVVPFYLQDTLGGAGFVRRYHEEMLGSDASKATLRGFRDLRFRGPNVLLLQAEYRVKIWGPIDGTVFFDTGAAAVRRSGLSLDRFKSDAGISLSFMTIDATAFRLDVGGGGGEGVRVFFSVGPIFQR